jgi:hypothetical protein
VVVAPDARVGRRAAALLETTALTRAAVSTHLDRSFAFEMDDQRS